MTKENILPYRSWFNIAATIRRVRQERNIKYRDGVERAAALAAVNIKDFESAIDAASYEFSQYEIIAPRWDGSIA